jgi:hypothetical protein
MHGLAIMSLHLCSSIDIRGSETSFCYLTIGRDQHIQSLTFQEQQLNEFCL